MARPLSRKISLFLAKGSLERGELYVVRVRLPSVHDTLVELFYRFIRADFSREGGQPLGFGTLWKYMLDGQVRLVTIYGLRVPEVLLQTSQHECTLRPSAHPVDERCVDDEAHC
jgi:hypothetical protein